MEGGEVNNEQYNLACAQTDGTTDSSHVSNTPLSLHYTRHQRPVQSSTVQYSPVQYSTVQYSTVE